MKYPLSRSLILLFQILPFWVLSQSSKDFQWIDPVTDSSIQFLGQGWTHGELEAPYDRLPGKAKNMVREDVWNLSKHTAGIYLTFSSDAPEIRVRYQAGGGLQMPHMPATGVSGVDLYVSDSRSKELLYCQGRYDFKDTISYTFSNLNTRHPDQGQIYEYNLYLPLYNSVKWMEIGVPAGSSLSERLAKKEKPIVVYGTSIAQGGCASRPAMAWTSICQRTLGRPVINLAFSGNGRLEEEVIGLINEIDASIFILDCLPNLTNAEEYPEEELTERIIQSVKTLRDDHPQTPILLTAHAGYSQDQVTGSAFESVERVNEIQQKAFHHLQKEGVNHLYLLSRDAIDMCMDCTVDGTHQTDLGMEYYAKAYLKKIHQIMEVAP